jgi:hypothetical protein
VRRLAVFLDIENLFPFWRRSSGVDLDEHFDPDDYRRVVAQIEERTAAHGEVVVRHAYGRWDNPARHLAAALLRDVGYELQHMPSFEKTDRDLRDLKNGGDILLATRAMRMAIEPDFIDGVVVGAADKDYHPLVTELRRLGLWVSCLSFPFVGTEQARLAEAFDATIFLDSVPRWIALDAAQSLGRAGARTGGAAATAPAPSRTTSERMPPQKARPRVDQTESTGALGERILATIRLGAPRIAVRRLIEEHGALDATDSGHLINVLATAELLEIDEEKVVRPAAPLDRERWDTVIDDWHVRAVVRARLRAVAPAIPQVAEGVRVVREQARAAFGARAHDVGELIEASLAQLADAEYRSAAQRSAQ